MSRWRLNRTAFFLNLFLSSKGRRLSQAFSLLLAGTTPSIPRFPRMRIREENCNMVLLAVVACFSVAVAGGATLLGLAGNKPIQFADRTAGRVEQAPSPDKRIIYVNDGPAVRVVGAPFVPNTNPRER
jgi:hypothetical protein